MSVKLNRIEKEFIFRKLIGKSIPVKILHNKKEIIGTLGDYSEDTIRYAFAAPVEAPQFREGESIDAYFVYENTYHTFKTRIDKKTESHIVLRQPDAVMKSLKRQYERMKDSNDIRIYFKVHGKKVELNFPQTENYTRPGSIAPREDFDPSSIRRLIVAFRKKIETFVSENKIIMLRNRVPSTYEEKLLVKTGKILWLPSMVEGPVKGEVFPEPTLVTYHDLILYEEELGTPRGEIEGKLSHILREKHKKGYHSQLYVPMFYNEYFIGYIYCVNMITNPKKIDIQLLKYVYQFSKFLCHSLHLNQYFLEKQSDDLDYETPIIDISASGLLFANQNRELANELVLHASIEVTLKILTRKILVTARITRKFRDATTFYYGLQFTSITPEDFRYVYEFIYGKPYVLDRETRIESVEFDEPQRKISEQVDASLFADLLSDDD